MSYPAQRSSAPALGVTVWPWVIGLWDDHARCIVHTHEVRNRPGQTVTDARRRRRRLAETHLTFERAPIIRLRWEPSLFSAAGPVTQAICCAQRAVEDPPGRKKIPPGRHLTLRSRLHILARVRCLQGIAFPSGLLKYGVCSPDGSGFAGSLRVSLRFDSFPLQG